MNVVATAPEVAHQPASTPAPTDVTPRLSPAKGLAILFSLAMIGLVLWPIHKNWVARPQDSFPFSYYPMFTDTGMRPDAHRETYLIGRDAQGNRYTIRHSYISPGGRLVRVRSWTRRAVSRGDAARVCGSTSAEIARRNPSTLRRVTTLQVVSGTYDLQAYLAGDKMPISEQVHAECDVRRGAR